jgi:SAM-dependent methyltransferase
VTRWTRANVRHLRGVFRQSANPAAVVYESLGDPFVAIAPGWLNLGLWEGPGTPPEAAVAPRRLVETLAAELPRGGVILDVGNGLGVQDPVIAEAARPRQLVALNVTAWQLREGAQALAQAGAAPVCADATRLPLATESVDGVICVEAAFHFSSRAAFFADVRRVLRPGGVLTMSDVTLERAPRGALELIAGAANLRFWGLRRRAILSRADIAQMAERAGLSEVRIEVRTERVIDPMLEFTRGRLRRLTGVPHAQLLAARFMLAQCALLRRRRLIEYVLLRARRPD